MHSDHIMITRLIKLTNETEKHLNPKNDFSKRHETHLHPDFKNEINITTNMQPSCHRHASSRILGVGCAWDTALTHWECQMNLVWFQGFLPLPQKKLRHQPLSPGASRAEFWEGLNVSQKNVFSESSKTPPFLAPCIFGISTLSIGGLLGEATKPGISSRSFYQRLRMLLHRLQHQCLHGHCSKTHQKNKNAQAVHE